MQPDELQERIISKMNAARVAAPAIHAFLGAVAKVRAGDNGQVPEAAIEPVPAVPSLESMPAAGPAHAKLLNQLAVIKLNGGLGTGMGLDKAKSLMPVKGGETFLDFIARQIFHLRKTFAAPDLSFFLMDSFSTQKDTLDFLGKYPELARGDALDFLQSMVPKLEAKTLEPMAWPADPELEWCPPGHGDIYPSMLGCGLIDRLLAKGVKFLFVSNSDNLGATVDLALLRYFDDSGLSFLMEVAERTAADKKGGHLARRKSNNRLLLRESAQCPSGDADAFQDIARHRYFNTNNLWIRLDHLKAALPENGGALSLPLITNSKTVDPKLPDSPKVLQLESAMGAAIECFDQAGAIMVPRTRFAPVKTTSDLLGLRSDAFDVTDDHRIILAPVRQGQPPIIDLDGKHYKLMAGFDAGFPTAPSLVNCRSLKVTGPLVFGPGVVCEGAVEFTNAGASKAVPPGHYKDTVVAL